MLDPFRAIERRIFQCRGALYEGDIFSILLGSPFVIRSFEFGLADGALNCSRGYATTLSYADRFWEIYDQRYPESTAEELCLFDVKSTIANQAGEQLYFATRRQRRHVAFFIGIMAANPGFVELIPNFHQDREADANVFDACGNPSDAKEVAINVSRVSKLPPSAYGYIDQCGAPYRLPIWLLPEAMSRVRQRVRGGRVYTNPWTKVAFPDWKPTTTRSLRCLSPAEHSSQATAYEAVMQICQSANHSAHSSMKLDFVGAQPRLADFRLKIGDRTVWVQHKLDLTIRSATDNLQNVPAARGDGQDRRYYFSAFERFDFLWYQFNFLTDSNPIQEVFYFIPEKDLPDHFYTSTDQTVDLMDIPDLQRFQLSLSNDSWIRAVEAIIRANARPRRSHERPLREGEATTALAENESQTRTQERAFERTLKGQHEYSEASTRAARRFFYAIMRDCAESLSGLLVVFASKSPAGELGYCRYAWSSDDADSFRRYGRIPTAAHQLPAQTEVVPISFYTQYAEASFQGPNLRAAHFRRLNSCSLRRLVAWDIGGPDTELNAIAPAIIPSDDFQPSDLQRSIFARNLALDKNAGGRDEKNPGLSALLNSGLYIADYAPVQVGPEILELSPWARVRELLERFTLCEPFEHPRRLQRQPSDYRHTLQSLYQELEQQQRKADLHEPDY